ncbi:two-component response regulator-like APRR1 [Bidens hawaiensis]|uniref:two-component response regulator-like APRR1 n=1 Tax=Bidens hawaiensis TaxID=980011 RepID=UPI0040495B87
MTEMKLAMSKKDGTSTRFHWTTPMDTAFLQAMITEKDNGNRIDGTFTPQAYTNMVEELSKAFEMDLTKDHLKNRLKTLKYHFSKFYDVLKGDSMSSFSWDLSTKLLGAEEEVWEKLIKESPRAAKWRDKPILHYHEMLELFAKERATGARAETAKQRNKRLKENDHTPETIDEIDQMVETNDITLENITSADDIHVVSETPDSQAKYPSFSKSKKRKLEKDDEFTTTLMSSINNVADAIDKSTKDLCKVMEGSRARVYSEEEIYKELEIMGIVSEEEIFDAYLFLVERPEKARALFGCPLNKRPLPKDAKSEDYDCMIDDNTSNYIWWCEGVANVTNIDGLFAIEKADDQSWEHKDESVDEFLTMISVKSPRQVIDALNAEGSNIGIILSEVDLPKAKGLKMLKRIMRKELQRIPIIMMSAQDEVPLVVKCLSLGAADYLVKPLRTNELLNLWTHMWRRRRMLGLTEKKMMTCKFDLVFSDHSDVNTNSTVFSDDDLDEKSRKSANLEMSLSIHHANEINVILSNDRSSLPETNDHQKGKLTSNPKKSKLMIGQSSAFFTYVNTSKPTRKVLVSVDETTLLSRTHKESNLRADMDSPPVTVHGQNIQKRIKTSGEESQIDEFPNSNSFNPHSAYPYYLHGPMNQVMMPSSMYHAHYPPHHMAGMTSFPYYPSINLNIQPGQMPHPWSTYGSMSSNDGKGQSQSIDRREAALIKFRRKRKERCFDKKIRYINRKKLAERRPRVRGQFVRKVNGIDVDLNGHPVSTDFDDEDDDEED